MEFDFTIPEWAVSDEAKAWCCGLFLGCMVRLYRACLKWFKRAGTEHHD